MPHDHPLLPFFATALAVALFSLMDALMKGASLSAGLFSALFLRSLFGLAMTLPLWHAHGRPLPDRRVLRLHCKRGLASLAMVALFFFALTRLPIAEAIALSFVAPLIALYLAYVLLGEQIGPRAITGSLLGLAGVMVIAGGRFQAGLLGHEAAWGIVAVLMSAVLFAWALILQRQLAQMSSPQEIAFFQNLVAVTVLAVPAIWLLHWPDARIVAEIGAAALLTTLSLLLLSWAYARAEAQRLVPVEYSAFLWAMLFGWLFFDERLGIATMAGAPLIVIACWIAAPRRRTEQTAL